MEDSSELSRLDFDFPGRADYSPRTKTAVVGPGSVCLLCHMASDGLSGPLVFSAEIH